MTIKKNILKKPTWIKIKFPSDFNKIQEIKNILRKQNLHTVCEEAACPNLSECFNNGTATFMILGSICTRRCPFCNVSHGRPKNLDKHEPKNLADTISLMGLNYVVITSVDRDDLKDGGSNHFSQCITEIRKTTNVKIEILVPDFRNCMEIALKNLIINPPDVFNHNLENVPRLYKKIRPGANYEMSLALLKNFKKACPTIPTKSGLMIGLGETNEEILKVMYDLRSNDVSMLTLGQYLQPSKHHWPVKRYLSLVDFDYFKKEAINMGFTHVASGPLVRSSYHADLQVLGLEVK